MKIENFTQVKVAETVLHYTVFIVCLFINSEMFAPLPNKETIDEQSMNRCDITVSLAVEELFAPSAACCFTLIRPHSPSEAD